MARFSIGIVSHGVNVHAQCFEDFARGIADALRALGHEVVPPSDSNPGRLIMFGAGNLRDPAGKIPKDAIVYNAEQLVATRDPEQFIQNWKQYQKFSVWDYSESNVVALKELGIERAVLCPVGYVPSMTKILPAAEQDIDVLHYGSTNPRRLVILRALKAAGLNIVQLFGVYGAERDAVIARSKVVLNLHFYLNPIFEIFRVSHLLANRKCVVAEDGGQDQTLEDFAARSTALVPYERLVEACCFFVEDKQSREAIAEQGHEEFKKIDLVENVRKALEQS